MTVNFDRVSKIYDMTRSMPTEMEDAVMRQIIENCELFPGSSVLELGVGTGRIALPLMDRLKLNYIGIDISEKMMAQLRAKSKSPMHLVRADVCNPPFRSKIFDAVLAVHIFHLVPNWRDSIRQAWRVLKPEGVMMIAGEGGNRMFSLGMLTEGMPAKYAARVSEIADRLGMKGHRIGMVGIKEAVDALSHLGAAVLLPSPIEHTMKVPASILVGLIAGRAFQALWETPQDLLDSCVADIKALLTECYGSFDALIPMKRRFEMVRAIF